MSATENEIDDKIRAHAVAQEWAGVITGWIVVIAVTEYQDGEECSGVKTVFPPGGTNWPMTLGMVEGARIRLHKTFGDD